MMMRKPLLLLLAPLLACGSPTDPISGQQLLGQSFGVPGVNASYDYVIVGGGTAGLLLANRLSASPANTVAVIEAGTFYEFSNGNISAIPRYVWTGTGMTLDDANPLVDWMFTTSPEIGFGNQSIHYARGRALGGSSARNHIGYQRGTAGSYDKWAADVGDAGFAWSNFQSFFDKSVTFHKVDASKRRANSTPPDDPAGARATGGEVSVSYTNYVGPFTSWALKAVRALGMKAIPGYIGGVLIGSSWDMRSVDPKTMVRDSAETAFLRPVLKRPNLVVYPNTMATRVLFEGTKAVGVQTDTLGKVTRLTARKEVILSAGVFQSPQLLMVSGIGPKAILSKYGIPVIADLPGVGENLHDHPAALVVHKVKTPSSTQFNTAAKRVAADASFLRDGTGPLSGTGGEIIGWEKVPRRLISKKTAADLDAAVPKDWPDLEILATEGYPGPIPPDDGDYVGIDIALVNTFSRGTVSISSASSLDPPVIHINFLSDPRDQEILIAAVRRAREIFADKTLAPVLIGDEISPGNATQSDEDILSYIHKSAQIFFHASSTCKMGTKGDEQAVVDSKGRVFGVQALRVVDLSAVPFLPPGHPMATVYALAEKQAAAILGGT
ncbi:glucose-methanol-choline oxidoreductase [Bimuria novae-zelandiae CBS 107.79]|uniref:Glucose-methanol-choline oxidoreductase n=1 Tax=Bimuria novae-zelandiae CBS 107.79 TaxID=1447943 RepID=A0A6A5VYE3_9PLEO|nr:glucose-methanol-choline oxidoreductase [Bimuria novae-zelandiae CBS 107.79]